MGTQQEYRSGLRQLGKSDLRVSPLSFGCMSMTEHSRANVQLLQKAYEHGIVVFDTADIYGDGMNEMLVGDALKPMRQEVVIATKGGNQRQADGSLRWAPSRAYLMRAVENSLRRLKTDYIDLYQLHGGTLEDPIDELIDTFELLKQQGKIRWYGISSIRPNVIKSYAERSRVASVMTQYSLLDRRPEEEVLDLLESAGVGVIVRGAIAQGLLIQKDPAPYLQYTESEVARAHKAVGVLAQEQGVSKLEIALNYVYAHPAVATVALGIRTQAQLDEAIGVMNRMHPLSAEQSDLLRQAVREIQYTDHR